MLTRGQTYLRRRNQIHYGSTSEQFFYECVSTHIYINSCHVRLLGNTLLARPKMEDRRTMSPLAVKSLLCCKSLGWGSSRLENLWNKSNQVCLEETLISLHGIDSQKSVLRIGTCEKYWCIVLFINPKTHSL